MARGSYHIHPHVFSMTRLFLGWGGKSVEAKEKAPYISPPTDIARVFGGLELLIGPQCTRLPLILGVLLL